jgi:hypothetical protein
MSDPSDPQAALVALQLATALVDPYATWHVEAPDEATLLERLTAIGPVPQADLFEPWSEGDPWRARVLWPLAPAAGPPDEAQLDALLAHGTLEPGLPPGRTEWLDRGRLGEDVLVSRLDGGDAGIEAVAWSDLESGGLLEPDVVHHETDDPGITALAYALFAAVGVTGDNDTDQVSLVQERASGRFGLELQVAVPDRDPLAERQAVIDGVAAVIRTPPPGAPRLAPNLEWSYDLNRLRVWAWLVAPAEPVLPPDPSAGDLGAPNAVARHHARELARDGAVELHLPVFPVEPGASEPPLADDVLVALSEDLAPLGWLGARPRWMVSPEQRTFLATWSAPSVDVAALTAVLDQHVPGRPFRVVPGCPNGLEADWLGIDPTWWASGERVVCRWHCSLRGRDLLPRLHPRDGDATDRALADRLASLGRPDPVWVGPATMNAADAPSARAALRLVLPPLTPRDWPGVVEALGQLADPVVGPSCWVAMGRRFTLLLFRTDTPFDPDAEPAPWVWEARS